MKEQAIELLQLQAAKIEEKQFDLNAWKQQTGLLLMRIFGEHDPKAKQINNLEYEFNSWALRDASGNASYQEGVRKNAAAILEAAILELRHFGLPKQQEPSESAAETFCSVIKDQLTGGQVKAIRTIIASNSNQEEKQRQLHEVLNKLDQTQLFDILTEIILKDQFSKFF